MTIMNLYATYGLPNCGDIKNVVATVFVERIDTEIDPMPKTREGAMIMANAFRELAHEMKYDYEVWKGLKNYLGLTQRLPHDADNL